MGIMICWQRKGLGDSRKELLFFLIVSFCLSGCTNDDLLENEMALVNGEMTRATAYVTVCTDAYVEVGGYEVYKGTICETHTLGGWAGPLKDREYIADGFPREYQTSGGGGGFNQEGVRWFNFVKLGAVYGVGSTLNLLEKAELEKVLNDLATRPAEYRKILEMLVKNNIKVDFKIDPNIKFNALYDKPTKTIYFRSKSEIHWTNFGEELLHAAQHLLFYGDVMDPSHKNYEFEVKVFYDLAHELAPQGVDDPPIVSTPYLPTFTDQRPSFGYEYSTWMKHLFEMRFFPDMERERFNEMCEEWQGYRGSTISDFTPALIRYFFAKPRPH